MRQVRRIYKLNTTEYGIQADVLLVYIIKLGHTCTHILTNKISPSRYRPRIPSSRTAKIPAPRTWPRRVTGSRDWSVATPWLMPCFMLSGQHTLNTQTGKSSLRPWVAEKVVRIARISASQRRLMEYALVHYTCCERLKMVINDLRSFMNRVQLFYRNRI